MSIEARIESLQRKHKELHTRIEAMRVVNGSDTEITALKLQKLRIKDEISKLSNPFNNV
jgi:hypothetical protein